MLTVSRIINVMTGGRWPEPLCSRIERRARDGNPMARLLRPIVNVRNSAHSERIMREFMERQ